MDRLKGGRDHGAGRGHRVEFTRTALRHDPATAQSRQRAHGYLSSASRAGEDLVDRAHGVDGLQLVALAG